MLDMSEVGERPPLATLSPAHERPVEVRGRVRGWRRGARSPGQWSARATAKKMGRMESSLTPQSTFPPAAVESYRSGLLEIHTSTSAHRTQGEPKERDLHRTRTPHRE